MYIIELIAQVSTKFKSGEFSFSKLFEKKIPKDEIQSEQKCEHIFVPIDSTKKVLACSKCGYIIKVDPKKIKKPNPFSKD